MNARVSCRLVTAAPAFMLGACGGSGQSVKPAASPQAAAAGVAATTTAAATAATVEFGVPECDDYLRKYLACIDSKVPEAARATVRQSVDQTKVAWKQAASTPQGKAGLAMACKQATDTARTAMSAYGCSW